MRYLGHIIEPGEPKFDETVIKALTEAQRPRNKQELLSLLGVFEVCRGFVSSHSHIAAPLNALLKKESPDEITAFNEVHYSVFKALIPAFMTPPVLALLQRVLKTDRAITTRRKQKLQNADSHETKGPADLALKCKQCSECKRRPAWL